MNRPTATGDNVSEWRNGWPVVFAAMIGHGCTLAMFAMSGGLFISPMKAEFGWSMSQVAFAPIVTLLSAFMMPLGGAVIDHFGSRRAAVFGICLFATAYIALAILPLSLPVLYTIAACLGILGPFGSSGPYVRSVATWFRRNTGSAFGATLAGTSVVGMAVVPGVALVIERFGWRAGYLTLAAILLAIALPLVLWLFHESRSASEGGSEQAGPVAASGQTWRETLADTRFWLLAIALGLAALPMGAFLAHLQPVLRSQGFALSTAAGYGSLFALAIGIGRVGGGLLIDRFWPYGVAGGCIALAASGCFAVSSLGPQDSSWAIAAAIVAIGLSYGAEVDFAAYFALKLFGLRDFSKIFGCVILILGSGTAIGGISASALFDWTGDYALLGPVTGILFLLSSATMFFMGIRHGRNSARSE